MRAINFNAGPAALSLPALERAQRELLDVEGTGMSIMEHSHRGKTYEAVHKQAIALTRELLSVPDDYHVLLMQGGASAQFAMLPMNLLVAGKTADYVLTGSWSQKAFKEAKTVGRSSGCRHDRAGQEVFPRSESGGDQARPERGLPPHHERTTPSSARSGTRFPKPRHVPLVADMSSDIMWRPFDVKKFGVIYAGAQKNLGPSGVVLVIARKDLVEGGRKDIPAIFQYRTHAENDSLYNTPPTFGIYILRNVLEEVKRGGGLGRDGTAQSRKGRSALRRDRRTAGFLSLSGGKGEPFAHERRVHSAERGARSGVSRRRTEAQHGRAQGPSFRGRYPRQHLQRCPLEWVHALTDYMNEFQKGR